MRNNVFILLISLFLMGFLICACSSSMPAHVTGPKPAALGKMNEIVVIADKDLWEGAVGDTFKYYFGSAYPIMPTPEPIFDIRHFTPEQLKLEPLRKELRTYVFLADLNDTDSQGTQMVASDLGRANYERTKEDMTFNTSIGKDKWAKGQVLFYLFANGHDKLNQTIQKSFSTIATRVNEHDSKQLEQATYANPVHTENTKLLKERYAIDLKLPTDYSNVEIEDERLVWFRKDDAEYTLNLVFDKSSYTNKSQLTDAAIKDWINDFGIRYVLTDTEGSKFIINDEDLPIFDYTREIDGAFVKELRGTWEMTQDFIAGPFFGYALLNESKNEVINVLAFLTAPGKNKRDRMQQLEFMVNSMKFVQ